MPRVVPPLHRHRDFRFYWLASLVSSAGSALTRVALPILVFGLTGSTFLTGLVAGLEALTYLLFGLFAGMLADCANAVLIGSIPVAGAFHHLAPAHATSALYGPHTVIGIIAPGLAALLFKVLSVPSVLALDALSFIASAPLLRALHTALTGARGGTTGGGHQQHHLPPVANAGGALAGALGVRSAVLVAAAFAALSVAIDWLSPLRREASGALHSTA